MPIYPKGEHSVDCPPLFRSRDTKQPVEFSEAFCDRLMEYAETVIPSSLTDVLREGLGNRQAYVLPEELSSPKIVLFNPDNLSGVDALPFVTVRVDNRFFAIPARYLDASAFDEIPEDVRANPAPKPPLQPPIPPIGASGGRPRPPRPPSGKSAKGAPSGPRMPPGDPRASATRRPAGAGAGAPRPPGPRGSHAGPRKRPGPPGPRSSRSGPDGRRRRPAGPRASSVQRGRPPKPPAD